MTFPRVIAIIASDISHFLKECLKLQKIRYFFQLIRFEHTLFALPFAYLGSIIGAQGLPDLRTFLFINLAMVGARSGAMGFNRLIDRSIDAKNPRTQNRHLPQGLLKEKEVIIFVIISLILFFFAAYSLNTLTFLLSPLALFFLTFYSYSKRFTYFTHLLLGVTLSCGPIGGFIAVQGVLSLGALILGGAVLFWVAGFDCIYALQDMQFDKREGIYSIPACYGVHRTLFIVRIFHLLSFLLFLLLGIYQGLSSFYYFGLLLVGLLLFLENYLINKGDLQKIDLVFFKLNALVSLILLFSTLLDFLIPKAF